MLSPFPNKADVKYFTFVGWWDIGSMPNPTLLGISKLVVILPLLPSPLFEYPNQMQIRIRPYLLKILPLVV